MIQRRSRPRLPLEALHALGAERRFLRKKLQSHGTAQPSVFAFVDDTHAPGADLFEHPVVGDL
jgi:hypothetical protein